MSGAIVVEVVGGEVMLGIKELLETRHGAARILVDCLGDFLSVFKLFPGGKNQRKKKENKQTARCGVSESLNAVAIINPCSGKGQISARSSVGAQPRWDI